MTTKTRKRSAEREEFLSDIITAAVEGGINYWAAVSDYSWDHDGPTSVVVHEDAESTDYDGGTLVSSSGLVVKDPGVLVTVDTIASAVQKIVRGDARTGEPGLYFEPLGDYAVKLIAGASATNDAGDIDADMADVIVQVAVIGWVRYG